MLFSCFSCYYVASRCVLQNFDLKSWVNCKYIELSFIVCTLKQA